MKIFVNAGHNTEKEKGCSFGDLKEWELNIKVRDEFLKLVKATPVPDNLSLRESIDWVNARCFPSDLAIDIHFNWNNDKNIRGVESYFFDKSELAEIFARRVSKATNVPNRGAISDRFSSVGSLGWLRQLKCKSVIVECLYLSNSEDRELIDVKKIAEGLDNACREISPIDFETIIPKLKDAGLSFMDIISWLKRFFQRHIT